MRVACSLAPLICLFLAAPVPAVQPPPQEPTPDSLQADEKILQDIKIATHDAALLDYFRSLTHKQPDPKIVAQHMNDLGDKTFKKREKAYADLFALSSAVLPSLREADEKYKHVAEGNVERTRRVFDLIRRIEEQVNPSVQGAGARLLAGRKPAAAAEVLLAFLPSAANEYVINEVCDTLTLLAVRDGKPEPALLKAVEDKIAIRRAAAASALLRAGVKEQVAKLRPLLKDPEPVVRLRVALALVAYKDNDALPQLVNAIGHLTPEELLHAEEVLLRLAGKDAPDVALGTDVPTRQAAANAWNGWWEKAKGGIDLARIDLDKAPVGFTLVARQTAFRIVNNVRMPAVGQVMELDRHKKPRWTIEIGTMPVDAQIIGPNRVLVTEYTGLRVTERDFRGNIKWEKSVPSNPLSARRLPNGNTFVVMRTAVVEYDRAGKEVFNHPRMNFDCYRAAKLPNGEILVVTQQGQIQRIDPKTNQVVKTFSVGTSINTFFGSVDILANGNLLIGLHLNNKVVEYDPDGNKKWEANVAQPFSVQRLANGNTLVASNQFQNQNHRRVIELDANGQQVAVIELDNTSTLYVARRR